MSDNIGRANDWAVEESSSNGNPDFGHSFADRADNRGQARLTQEERECRSDCNEAVTIRWRAKLWAEHLAQAREHFVFDARSFGAEGSLRNDTCVTKRS